MKLQMLYLNVHGLNDLATVDNLKNYIQHNSIDLFFLQEHKLRGQGATNLGNKLWKRATTFITEAELDYTIDGF